MSSGPAFSATIQSFPNFYPDLMPRQPDLPDPALVLVDYVDRNPKSSASAVILEIVLASTHPDFVMSLFTATALSSSVRRAISDYLTYTLVHGLANEDQQNLFAWAQAKMLAGP